MPAGGFGWGFLVASQARGEMFWVGELPDAAPAEQVTPSQPTSRQMAEREPR